jgi:hypothetical protein
MRVWTWDLSEPLLTPYSTFSRLHLTVEMGEIIFLKRLLRKARCVQLRLSLTSQKLVLTCRIMSAISTYLALQERKNRSSGRKIRHVYHGAMPC